MLVTSIIGIRESCDPKRQGPEASTLPQALRLNHTLDAVSACQGVPEDATVSQLRWKVFIGAQCDQ